MPNGDVGQSGRKSDISSTPSRLTSDTSLIANEGVQIIASPSNSETIYVGTSSSITANSGDGDGFPLIAGAALFLPEVHPSDIYLVSPSASNLVVWYYIK